MPEVPRALNFVASVACHRYNLSCNTPVSGQGHKGLHWPFIFFDNAVRLALIMDTDSAVNSNSENVKPALYLHPGRCGKTDSAIMRQDFFII
jgi:hypothetical protein